MAPAFVMALDAGGGGVRCMVVDADTGARTVAVRAVSHPVAPGTEGWGYDLDTRAIWAAACEATREACGRAGVASGRLAGIAVTSMRHAMVLLDGAGAVLYAVPNRDARAAGQGMELAGERGAEIHRLTGHWPSPIATSARLLWLKENRPEVLAAARSCLAIDEWLAHRLCGRAAAGPSQAAETSLFDLARGQWAGDLIASLGLPRAIFPEVRPAGSRLGALAKEAAEALGLAAGVPVAVGGADTQCALLGSGAVEPGRIGVVAGTTVPVQLVTDRPAVDPAARLWTGCHVVPGRYVVESNAGAAGEALDWLGRLVFPGDPLAAARVAAEAASSTPGAGGFLSSVGASLFNASGLGLPISTVSFSHLSASAKQASLRHLSRAVLEGLACSVRANLEQVLAAGTASDAPVALSGGLSRSPFWASLLADVCGRPMQSGATAEASLLGVAVCAGAGGGVWADLAAGAARIAKPGPRKDPDAGNRGRYAGLYDDWQRWRQAREAADGLAAESVLRSADDAGTARPGVPAAAGFRPAMMVSVPVDEPSLARLRDLGKVEYCTYTMRQRVLTGDDLVETLAPFQVLVTEVDIVDAESLERLPDLRVVFVCRSNPVNVDVAACTAHGIPVLNTPGRNAIAVAEMTVAALLSLARHVPAADRFTREPGAEAGDMARMGRAHEAFRGTELAGKTVGLVGFGRIGRMVAERLAPFGVHLVAHDPVLPPDAVLRGGAEPVSLDDLLARADVVSLHAAVTEKTRGLLGAAEMRRMKRGALVVNTARAALVDEAALAEAIRGGHLGGAAVDVWRQEPPGADHPLLSLPNVVATPHIAGDTTEVEGHQGDTVASALEALCRGEFPDNVLNPETLAAFRWTGERRKPSAEEKEALAKGTGPAITDLEAEEESASSEAAEPSPVPPSAPAPAPAPAPVSAPPPGPGPAPHRSFLGRLFGRSKPPAPADAAAPAPASASVPAPAPASPAPGASPAAGAARARFAAIVEDFVARIPQDPAIREFSQGKSVSVRYSIPDAGMAFAMSFCDDLSASMGEPPYKPSLTLKMNAAILDAVMMERLGGMKAAMSGEMAFSGNTMKAMALQRIQKDLCRLYQEASAAHGGPGDLTALAAPAPVAAPAASPAAAAPAVPYGVPDAASPAIVLAAPAVIRRVGDERDELVAMVEDLYASKLLTSTGGNVSVRRASKPDEAWITPSSLPKGALSPEMMVRVNLEGEALDEDARAPSSERLMHTRILATRPDVHAVVHSHGIQAFMMGVSGLPFFPVCTESAFLGEVRRVPFVMPGSDELAEVATKILGNGRAVFLVNHGLIVAGGSLRRAVDMTKMVERTSEVLLTMAKLGKVPPPLPPDVLAQLSSLGDLVA